MPRKTGAVMKYQLGVGCDERFSIWTEDFKDKLVLDDLCESGSLSEREIIIVFHKMIDRVSEFMGRKRDA